jgi:hypothetical protein
LANTAGGAVAEYEPSEARSGVSNSGRHQRRQRGTLRQTFGKLQTVQESLGIDYLPGISYNQRR